MSFQHVQKLKADDFDYKCKPDQEASTCRAQILSPMFTETWSAALVHVPTAPWCSAFHQLIPCSIICVFHGSFPKPVICLIYIPGEVRLSNTVIKNLLGVVTKD